MSKEQTALERIKNEVAVEMYGQPILSFGRFAELDSDCKVDLIDEIAKRFAQECCQATISDYKEKLKAEISKMMTLNGITRHPFKVEAAEILKLIDSIK